MNWQRRLAAWTSSHQRELDLALVVLVAAIGVLTATFAPVDGSERETDVFAYLLVLGGPVALYWRRTKPLIALPVATLFVFVYWVADYAAGSDLILWIAFFSATRHGGQNRRLVWQVVGIVLLAVLVIATIGVIVPTEDLPAVAVLGLFFIHGTAAAVGEALYQRSQYVSELEQRATMLEADIENKTALAAVEERTRIAREMHDIIAHGMSAVVVQAQAAQRMVDADPERAKRALETIETIGRDSVDEMRRMLGVLRDGEGEPALAPQPTFDELESLRRRVEEAGVDVAIDVVGARRPLPPGLELTGFRVVQEALTNVMRHAGRPVAAEATVTFGDHAVEIVVVDDGLGLAASTATAGSGHGLLGMQERVEIYNGSFSAGPRTGGGYRVAVSLPIPTTAPAAAEVTA